MYLTKNFFVKLSFFITNVSNIIAETNDNFSQDHFELKSFILAQKLKFTNPSKFSDFPFLAALHVYSSLHVY